METKTIEVWYAVDLNGDGYMYSTKPYKFQDKWLGFACDTCYGALKEVMPDLSWEDEPVKVTLQISY